MRLRFLGTAVLTILIVYFARAEVPPADACGIKLVIKGKAMRPSNKVAARTGGAAGRVAAKEAREPVAAGPRRQAKDAPVDSSTSRRAKPIPIRGGSEVDPTQPAEPTKPTPRVARAPEKTAKPAPTKAKQPVAATPERVETEPVDDEPADQQPQVAAKKTTAKERKAAARTQPDDSSTDPLEVEVFFEYAASSFDSEGEASLEDVVTWLTANPDRSIVIEGFADPKGSATANLKLSRKRALSVKNYLMSKSGTPSERIKLIPRGENRLGYPNDDPRNRRVLIKKR